MQHFTLFSDDIKQNTATTNSHKKCLIELLREIKVLASSLTTIWENNDGCAEKNICASAL